MSHFFSRTKFVQIPKISLFSSLHKTFLKKAQKSQKLFFFWRDCLSIQPSIHTHLLTLWHRNGDTLWARLFNSNWCFGHWDSDPSDVRVIAIGAVVSTPVVVPGAANRLRSDTIVKSWIHSSTFMSSTAWILTLEMDYWFSGRKPVILPTRQ